MTLERAHCTINNFYLNRKLGELGEVHVYELELELNLSGYSEKRLSTREQAVQK